MNEKYHELDIIEKWKNYPLELPSVQEFKTIRRILNITQQKVAHESNTKQSLISKMEKGMTPSYETIRKIYRYYMIEISKWREKNKDKELTAEKLMNKGIVSVKPTDSISTAYKKMRKNGYSQLPVIEKGKMVGSVYERSALNPDIIKGYVKKVSQIMEEPFSIIKHNTPESLVAQHLMTSPAVVVQNEKGELVGIITKSDFLVRRY